MEQPILAVVALLCALAAVVWGRSALRFQQGWHRSQAEYGESSDQAVLAGAAFRKELHASLLYGLLAVASFIVAVAGTPEAEALFGLVAIPVGMSIYYNRDFRRVARIAEDRNELERKAQEVLTQDELAPRKWAARLAPEELPDFPGFELGRVYEPGTGMMAGDFYDVFRVSPSRIAAVIGDVTGHGIEASITAFQAKYLLRVFLRQYRDPAQAMEELNSQMSALERVEEFISLLVVVFDTDSGTLRVCSAGHPAGWLWHAKEVRPLRATGPLLMLDPNSHYHSREIDLESGDLVLLYTDGLAEARSGDQFFGEERIANTLRRDPGVPPDVLCKTLLEAAKDFATEPVTDDTAILAIRRS
jgi:phosphoserine phosphatase RsbU/P